MKDRRAVPDPEADSALNTQVGGDHYKSFVIQPIEFISKNKLGFLQGDIVKRICRYNKTGGKGLQDLEKIQHEIDLIIELEDLTSANFSTYRPISGDI